MSSRGCSIYRMLIFVIFLVPMMTTSSSSSDETVNKHTYDNVTVTSSEEASDFIVSSLRTSTAIRSLRTSRLLDFFRMVKFRIGSGPCKGAAGGSPGTCLTLLKCKEKGGKADGTCASGFGVCCIKEVECGSTVKHNNTYLVNDGYPMKANSIMNCVYNIQKVNDDICQLRIDFQQLVLAGPNAQSLCLQDKLSITAPVGGYPIILCGTNSGQHVYVEMERGYGSARISIGLTTTDIDRNWRIKVSQISCTSRQRAPPNCMQYFTSHTGTIQSFNFKDVEGVHQLGGLQYTICIKSGEGICGITYRTSVFSLSGDASSPSDASVGESGDTVCLRDFVMVPFLSRPPSTATSPDRYCGTSFRELSTYSKPFELRVVTDEDEVGDAYNRGFSITYTQIPC